MSQGVARPLSSFCLHEWLTPPPPPTPGVTTVPRTAIVGIPPDHLKTNSYVAAELREHRQIYLTEGRPANGRWGGVLPRLQDGRWDGTGTLEMRYQSLCEVPVYAQVTGSAGDKESSMHCTDFSWLQK
jgi:hypothetical protein